MRLIRIREVISITGLSRATIYRLSKLGQFPQPAKIGPKISVWRLTDLQKWAEGLPTRNPGRRA